MNLREIKALHAKSEQNSTEGAKASVELIHALSMAEWSGGEEVEIHEYVSEKIKVFEWAVYQKAAKYIKRELDQDPSAYYHGKIGETKQVKRRIGTEACEKIIAAYRNSLAYFLEHNIKVEVRGEKEEETKVPSGKAQEKAKEKAKEEAQKEAKKKKEEAEKLYAKAAKHGNAAALCRQYVSLPERKIDKLGRQEPLDLLIKLANCGNIDAKLELARQYLNSKTGQLRRIVRGRDSEDERARIRKESYEAKDEVRQRKVKGFKILIALARSGCSKALRDYPYWYKKNLSTVGVVNEDDAKELRSYARESGNPGSYAPYLREGVGGETDVSKADELYLEANALLFVALVKARGGDDEERAFTRLRGARSSRWDLSAIEYRLKTIAGATVHLVAEKLRKDPHSDFCKGGSREVELVSLHSKIIEALEVREWSPLRNDLSFNPDEIQDIALGIANGIATSEINPNLDPIPFGEQIGRISNRIKHYRSPPGKDGSDVSKLVKARRLLNDAPGKNLIPALNILGKLVLNGCKAAEAEYNREFRNVKRSDIGEENRIIAEELKWAAEQRSAKTGLVGEASGVKVGGAAEEGKPGPGPANDHASGYGSKSPSYYSSYYRSQHPTRGTRHRLNIVEHNAATTQQSERG